MGLLQFFIVNKILKTLQRSKEDRERRERVIKKRIRTNSGSLLKGMTAAKIPSMIKGLDSRSETKRENCHLVLRLFTGHDFGAESKTWRDWYEVNKERPAHEWWADRLGRRGYNTYGLELDEQIAVALKAMEDSDPLVRRTASRLLGHLTNTVVKFAPEGTPKIRRWQIGKWQALYEKRKKVRAEKSRKGDS